MSEQGPSAERDVTRPATAEDVITEVENRLRSYGDPEDARRIALLQIEAYREGRARTYVLSPAERDALVEYEADVPMPYHLDLNNPPLSKCSGCGRSTWSASEVGQTCGMLQPSGARCDGILPPAVTRPTDATNGAGVGTEVGDE
jgi:hypothetical protein